MSFHRNCELHSQKKSSVQRGRGVGGVLNSLYNQLTPITKQQGEKILAPPNTKSTKVSLQDTAAHAGLQLILDKVVKRRKGKTFKTSMVNDTTHLDDAVKTNVKPRAKRSSAVAISRGEAKRNKHDVFDDMSLDDEVQNT